MLIAHACSPKQLYIPEKARCGVKDIDNIKWNIKLLHTHSGVDNLVGLRGGGE